MLFLEYVAHLGTINNSLVYQIEKLTVYKSMNFETVETFDKALKEKKMNVLTAEFRQRSLLMFQFTQS